MRKMAAATIVFIVASLFVVIFTQPAAASPTTATVQLTGTTQYPDTTYTTTTTISGVVFYDLPDPTTVTTEIVETIPQLLNALYVGNALIFLELLLIGGGIIWLASFR